MCISGHSPSRQETYNKLKSELSQKGKAVKVDDILEKLADAIEDADIKLTMAERELRCHTPTGPGVEQQTADYVRYVVFENSIDPDHLACSEGAS